MLKRIGLIVLLALAGFGGYLAYDKYRGDKWQSEDAAAPATVDWVAAAPGRVEPKSGEIRLGARAAEARP